MSSTTSTFSAMLNQYLPNELLREEFMKRDYLIQKVDKDDNWDGGTLIVPFKAAGASSVAYGSLTASTDIAEDKYVRGQVSGYKEVWGSMIFNQKDLMEHKSLSEQNFLKILPQAIDDFMDYMKMVVSINLMSGASFDALTVDGDNTGIITIKRPDRYQIGQKVILQNTTPTTATGYVSAIDVNTKKVTLVTARGGSTPLDCSSFSTALTSLVYNDGAQTSGNAFSSLRGALLSASNGGDSQLYGQTKTAYPYLQAINVDGSGVTASNIMEKVFDGLVTIRQLGKGSPSDIVMSFKNLGNCMKVVEQSKGAYNVTPGSQKASQYGFMELEIGSVTKGALKIVGVQEMDDDIIFFIDWRSLKFHSNGFFQKRQSPEGKEFFEIRNTSGFQYIVDVCLFGELVVNRPSYCGVMYGISYT